MQALDGTGRASSRTRKSHEMPEDFWMVDSRRVSSTTSWNRRWRASSKKGTLTRACACAHKASGRLRSFSCKSTPIRRHTHAQTNTDHHRRNRSPGRTTAGGWMIRDSQGRRHHSKHGRVLFAQARQTLLQGTSETPTEPPPPGSTNSCYICREESTSDGLAIRLPAAARKMTFRRLSGPLLSRQQAGTTQDAAG